MVAGGLSLFALGMSLFPMWYLTRQKQNLTTTPKALGGESIVRGAYVNSGSKDIGVDPDWDPVNRTWRGRKIMIKKKPSSLETGE